MQQIKAVDVPCFRKVLGEVSSPELHDQRLLLEEATNLLSGGAQDRAQALAASVWDTVYRGVWRSEPAFRAGPRFEYDKVNALLPDTDTKDTVIEFRQACIFGPFCDGNCGQSRAQVTPETCTG